MSTPDAMMKALEEMRAALEKFGPLPEPPPPRPAPPPPEPARKPRPRHPIPGAIYTIWHAETHIPYRGEINRKLIASEYLRRSSGLRHKLHAVFSATGRWEPVFSQDLHAWRNNRFAVPIPVYITCNYELLEP